MTVERIVLKTIYCGSCQRFKTIPADTIKCPACGNRFQYSPVGHIVKNVGR